MSAKGTGRVDLVSKSREQDLTLAFESNFFPDRMR